MARPKQVTAAMYAAYKILQRELDEDGELPAGFKLDLSGQTISITFPNDTVVTRDVGSNGDGTMYKPATTSLYGWHVFTVFAERMKKFNQWNMISKVLLEVLQFCLDNKKKVATRLEEIDKDFADKVAALKREMRPPDRCEPTPRICKDTGKPAMIVVKKR